MSSKMKDPWELEKGGQAHPRNRAPQSKSALPQQLDNLEEKELQQQEAEEQFAALTWSWWPHDQLRQLSARDRTGYTGNHPGRFGMSAERKAMTSWGSPFQSSTTFSIKKFFLEA